MMIASEVEHFMEPIREFAKTVEAAKETLVRRGERKTRYIYAVGDLNKMSARDDSKDATKKQESIATAKKLVETSRIEYESVSMTFVQEFMKFKADSAVELRRALFALAQMQTEFHKKTSDNWKEYEEHQYVAVPVGATDTSNCNIS